VAEPHSATAGSFYFSGVVDYWATDYLELVKSLDLATSDLQIGTHSANYDAASITYLETWNLGIHTARWLRATTTKGESEDKIRTAILMLKGLAARRGLLDVVGEIDDIAADLSEDHNLNKALRCCVSLCGRLADRFAHLGKVDHEQLVTVAGNFELWMFYVSFGARQQTLPRGGIEIASYRQLPLSEELRQLFSTYVREVAVHIETSRGSREDLLGKGRDIEALIANHLRSLLANSKTPSQETTPAKTRSETLFMECASLMEEAELIVRLTCPMCGGRVEHERKESGPDPARGRSMLDRFEITCPTCRITWPLTLAVQY
jgi:hypothetical protein